MSRAWPIPLPARTIHLVGDTQGISNARKGIVLDDLTRWTVPDVAHRFQVGDLVSGFGETERFPAAIEFMDNMGSGNWWACVGNHDYDYQNMERTPADGAASMGMPGLNFTVDLGYAVGIFTYVTAAYAYDPEPYDTAWLDEQLGINSDKPCLIVAHPNLVNAPAPNNIAPESDAILDVLSGHPNAKAWLCGHTHNPIDGAGIVDVLDVGHPVAHVDASALHYTIPDIDWNDRLVTFYVTVADDRLEVRFRDHGAHQWVGAGIEQTRRWVMPF